MIFQIRTRRKALLNFEKNFKKIFDLCRVSVVWDDFSITCFCFFRNPIFPRRQTVIVKHENWHFVFYSAFVEQSRAVTIRVSSPCFSSGSSYHNSSFGPFLQDFFGSTFSFGKFGQSSEASRIWKNDIWFSSLHQEHLRVLFCPFEGLRYWSRSEGKSHFLHGKIYYI